MIVVFAVVVVCCCFFSGLVRFFFFESFLYFQERDNAQGVNQSVKSRVAGFFCLYRARGEKRRNLLSRAFARECKKLFLLASPSIFFIFPIFILLFLPLSLSAIKKKNVLHLPTDMLPLRRARRRGSPPGGSREEEALCRRRRRCRCRRWRGGLLPATCGGGGRGGGGEGARCCRPSSLPRSPRPPRRRFQRLRRPPAARGPRALLLPAPGVAGPELRQR